MTTIRIPGTIDPALTGNSRAHPLTKYKRGQDLESDAYYAGRNANLEMMDPALPVTLNYVVARVKGARVLDDDNLIHGLKKCRDGIALALGIDDKHIVTGTLTQIRDPAGVGFIEVSIIPTEKEAAA